MNCKSVVRSLGHYLPPRIVKNSDLMKCMDTSDSWIVERSGIRERRFADPGVGSSQLALEAARRALRAAELEPSAIDYVVAATLSPDYMFPGIGVLVQHGLKMRTVPSLDIRVQCSGFTYGLATADAIIRAGQARRVLLVCAEVQSPALDLSTRGRDMAVLFGDGAGACILESESCAHASERPTARSEACGVIDSILGSDGAGAKNLAMLKPGSANAGFVSAQDVEAHALHPQMDGKLVFRHAVLKLEEIAREICKRNEISPQDLDLVVPHQANLRINETVRERLGLAPEKVFNNIEHYGNTTAATIPIALSEAYEKGVLKKGQLVLTMSFGSGFTWGANLLRW